MAVFQRLSKLPTAVLLGLFMVVPFSHSSDQFIINRAESALDDRYQYTYDLLKLVIEATQSDFGEGSLSISNNTMNRNRLFRSLKDGRTINVVAEAAKSKWNKQLIQIKIPIRKGIQGFRLFLIKQENASILASITTLEQLMALQTGSGSQWSTKVALQQAGFKVVEGMQYQSLFKMLSKDRFITFGRGINEIFQELEQYRQFYPELVVEGCIMLHIPLATYYYVAPNQPRLANRIQIGLQRIVENGKFDQLFYQRHCGSLLKSRLHTRRIFKINNPFISEADMNSVLGDDFLLSPKDDFTALCKKYSPEP